LWVTVALLALAILISPNNNYALPDTWFQIQLLFQGYTIYLIVLGILIIPEILSYTDILKNHEKHFEAEKSKLNVYQTIKSSLIGVVAGLIPGPNSTLASGFAYKFTKRNPEQQVINAEIANNSAVISALLPFITIGLPITTSGLIFSNLLDIKALFLPEEIFLSSIIPGLNKFELTAISITLIAILMYYLAINFIDFYVIIIDKLHNSMKSIMITIVGILMTFDLYMSELTMLAYLMLLLFFTTIGMLLKKKNIDPIPFMFTLLLGNNIIWTYMQYYQINF
jgi:TctA family transporter